MKSQLYSILSTLEDLELKAEAHHGYDSNICIKFRRLINCLLDLLESLKED